MTSKPAIGSSRTANSFSFKLISPQILCSRESECRACTQACTRACRLSAMASCKMQGKTYQSRVWRVLSGVDQPVRPSVTSGVGFGTGGAGSAYNVGQRQQVALTSQPCFNQQQPAGLIGPVHQSPRLRTHCMACDHREPARMQ